MSGIAGVVSLNQRPVDRLDQRLTVMNRMQRHRGLDHVGKWSHPSLLAGFGHQRLVVPDCASSPQPLRNPSGNWIVCDSKLENRIELRKELGPLHFGTVPDAEFILRAYERWGVDCVKHLRGSFAFAIWDDAKRELFATRDPLGVKPFSYTIQNDSFHFASEAKTLLPFVERIETDIEGLADYLTFQHCLDGKTLFRGIHELTAGQHLITTRGKVVVKRHQCDGFPTSELGEYDETIVASVEVQPQDCIEHIDNVLCHLDYPVGGYEAISQYLRAQASTKPVMELHQLGACPGYTQLEPGLINADCFSSDAYSPHETVQQLYAGDMEKFATETTWHRRLHVADRLCMANGIELRAPSQIHSPTEERVSSPTQSYDGLTGAFREFVIDTLSSTRALHRDLVNNREFCEQFESEPSFSSELWAMLSLEIWQQRFHDRASEIQNWQTQSRMAG